MPFSDSFPSLACKSYLLHVMLNSITFVLYFNIKTNEMTNYTLYICVCILKLMPRCNLVEALACIKHE